MAASREPSADEATACQLVTGTVLGVQVNPEFDER
jgi:hypothetical protein